MNQPANTTTPNANPNTPPEPAPPPNGNPPEQAEAAAQQPAADEIEETVLQRVLANQKAREKIARAMKHKVKIEGKDEELSYDDLQRNVQLTKASTQRFEEAARLRREYHQLQEAAKTNPDAFWELGRRLGLDPNRLVAERFANDLRQETMTPEERKAAELERKLADYERRDNEAKAQAEAAEMKRQSDTAYSRLLSEIGTEAKARGVSEDEVGKFVEETARHLREARRLQMPMTVQEAAQKAWDEGYEQPVSRKLSGLKTGKDLAEFLGPERRKMLREYELAELGKRDEQGRFVTPPAPEPVNGSAPKEPGQRVRKRWDEVFKR